MQNHYKLAISLFACVLGVRLEAAEQPTRVAVARLKEAACNSVNYENRFLALLELEGSQNPMARLDEARIRSFRCALRRLCEIETQVSGLPPAQEPLFDVTFAFPQAAEDMGVGSSVPGGVVKVPDSILDLLIALGEQASIRVSFHKLKTELATIGFVLFESLSPYMRWAYVGPNKVYFGFENSLYCCSREWYAKLFHKNTLQYDSSDARELFNSKEVKVVLDVICRHDIWSDARPKIGPIADCYIDRRFEFGLQENRHCFEVDQSKLNCLLVEPFQKEDYLKILQALGLSIDHTFEFSNIKLFAFGDNVYKYDSDMGMFFLVPGIKKGPQDLKLLPNGRAFEIVRAV